MLRNSDSESQIKNVVLTVYDSPSFGSSILHFDKFLKFVNWVITLLEKYFNSKSITSVRI